MGAGSSDAAKSADSSGVKGAWLVLGMLLLALTAGISAVLYQYQTTRRAIAYWGRDQAIRIRDAERVEFCRLESLPPGPAETLDLREPTAATLNEDEILQGAGGELWRVLERRPVEAMAGFSHLRHALLQDESYAWTQPTDLSTARAKYALLFEAAGGRVVILLDLERAYLRDARQSEWQSAYPISPFLKRFTERLIGEFAGVSGPSRAGEGE